MSSWIQGALEKTAGVRQAAYDRATGAAAYAQEVAGSAGANIAAGAEKVRSTDVRTLASQAAEGAAAQTAGLREAAQQKAAGAQVGMMDAFSQANARAYTMEGRMRMEAAVAADYAQQVKYRGDRVVKQKIRGEQGPPTADEVVEMMNEMAAEIRGGSNKGRRIAYLRKWAKDLDDDLTYEEVIESGEKKAEGDDEAAEAGTPEAAEADAARQERLAKMEGDGEAGPEPEPQGVLAAAQGMKEELAKLKTFQERMDFVKKQAYEASQLAAAKAAELDEHYKIRENAAAGVAAAKVKAGEAAQATKESLQERTANYRAGKGFTVEVPEGMQRVRIVTVKECFMRSNVVPDLISSFLRDPATTGSESVRCFAKILQHCLHGTEEFTAQVADTIACVIPPALRGRDSKKAMQEQLTAALKTGMVDAEIEAIRVNLNSNQNAAKTLREEIAKLEAASGAEEDGGAGRMAKVLSLSKDLIDINMEEVALTAKQHELLDTKATVHLGDKQSACDKVIAAVKEKYTEEAESTQEEKSKVGEQAGQTLSEKEAAEMEFQETDAKIQAELDRLRARETELREELATLENSISSLETQRAEAAEARDGTKASAETRQGKIALSESQLSTTELNVQLEMKGVEEVEKLLDDTFDEVARDVKEKASSVAATSVALAGSRLELLEAHVGFVHDALTVLQKKIAFCASELNERIEKRESMIKMGMENVADSLIPGFDKLEEQFVELVQQMKAVLGDFEPVRKQVEEAASGRCVLGAPCHSCADALLTQAGVRSEDNVELRTKIGAGLKSVLELKSSLEEAASSLEGRIEMEEVKWRGDAGDAAAPAAAVRAPNRHCLDRGPSLTKSAVLAGGGDSGCGFDRGRPAAGPGLRTQPGGGERTRE